MIFLKLSPTCWYSTIQQGPPKSRWVLVEDPGSVQKIWHSGLLKQSCVKGFPLQKYLCKNCPVYPPCLALLSRCFPGIPEIFSFSSFKISSVGRGRDEGSYWVTRLAIYFNYIPAFVKYFELDVQNKPSWFGKGLFQFDSSYVPFLKSPFDDIRKVTNEEKIPNPRCLQNWVIWDSSVHPTTKTKGKAPQRNLDSVDTRRICSKENHLGWFQNLRNLWYVFFFKQIFQGHNKR